MPLFAKGHLFQRRAYIPQKGKPLVRQRILRVGTEDLLIVFGLFANEDPTTTLTLK